MTYDDHIFTKMSIYTDLTDNFCNAVVTGPQSLNPRSLNMLMLVGHVLFIKDSVKLITFHALWTLYDGEVNSSDAQ